MKNSNQITGGVIFLIIITVGGYLVYDYFKNKGNSVVASITTKATDLITGSPSETPSDPVPPDDRSWNDPERTNGIISAIQTTKERDTVKAEIDFADPLYITEYNPHYKGVWVDKSGIIREKFSGKSYNKDADLEIISKYRGLFHYHVKYKGDDCYFPVSLIKEDGFWTTTSANWGNRKNLWGK